MKNARSPLLWGFIFGFIFLLSQSHHLISYSHRPSLLGLPFWLWCYMGFHLLLVIALMIFGRTIENN